MMYLDFTAGNKDYRLRLTTRSIVSLEKVLGMNPLAIFGNGDTIPTITTMVQILHASLQSMHHGITMEDAYNIFDEYMEDGHNINDFILTIVDLYKVSGLIKNSEGIDPKN